MTVTYVSMRRDWNTCSRAPWEVSRRKVGTKADADVPASVVGSYKLLTTETVDIARGRREGRIEGEEPGPKLRLREEVGESPCTGEREGDEGPLFEDDSAGRALSLSCSQRILRVVTFEDEDIRRGRLRPIVMSRSSESLP